MQHIVDTKNKTALPSLNLRHDLQKSLDRQHIDPSALSIFQRILLTTDGTVTDILEAYLFEQIQVVKLSEQLALLDYDLPIMNLKEGTEAIIRKVLLQGRISQKNFIYADSIIIPERLNEEFRVSLLNTKVPIGRLWFEQRVETFKEILEFSREPAGDLANHFNIQLSENLLSRTYCVFSNQKPVKMITEKFPENFFWRVFNSILPN